LKDKIFKFSAVVGLSGHCYVTIKFLRNLCLKKFLIVQNLKIAESSMFTFSKLFYWHSSRENISMKESE